MIYNQIVTWTAFAILAMFYSQVNSLRLWHGHDFTVDEDGGDDGETEHGVGEDQESSSPNWMERRKQPECLCCREPGNRVLREFRHSS